MYFADIYLDAKEIYATVHDNVEPSMFEGKSAEMFEGNERWEALDAPTGNVHDWGPTSTNIRERQSSGVYVLPSLVLRVSRSPLP